MVNINDTFAVNTSESLCDISHKIVSMVVVICENGIITLLSSFDSSQFWHKSGVNFQIQTLMSVNH